MSKKSHYLHFNYDKKTIDKILNKDLNKIIYNTHLESYYNAISSILNEAENHGISKEILINKLKLKHIKKQHKPKKYFLQPPPRL